MIVRALLLTLLALAALPAFGQSQTCRDTRCPVTLTATLQHGDLTFRRRLPQVVSDSRGGLWVADGIGSTEVLVFDSRGQFLRKVGRRGTGPGEMQALFAIQILPGDTLGVADVMGRISLYSRDGSFVRSRPPAHRHPTHPRPLDIGLRRQLDHPNPSGPRALPR